MAFEGLLHIRVVRPAAALGRGPDDVLRRVLDVAGFAVDAVLGVDLEARVLALLVVEHLVDARQGSRAAPVRRTWAGSPRSGSTGPSASGGRLVFLMVGGRDEHRAQLVETDDAVRLGIDERLVVLVR